MLPELVIPHSPQYTGENDKNHDSTSSPKNSLFNRNIYRMHVDKCNRLWILDTGTIGIGNTTVQACPYTLNVFDLTTDKILRKYQLRAEDLVSVINFLCHFRCRVKSVTNLLIREQKRATLLRDSQMNTCYGTGISCDAFILDEEIPRVSL